MIYPEFLKENDLIGVTAPSAGLNEVLFVNSVKLEFLGNGEWEEVDCRYQAVPDAIVPPQILTSVRERYPDAKIVEINRDKRDYELKLANGLELVYDLQYRLVDIDD